MEKTQKDRLEWFINFINLDLQYLSPVEVIKQSMDVATILAGLFPGHGIDSLSEWRKILTEWFTSEGADKSQLETCQKRLRKFLENMVNEIEKASQPLVGKHIDTGEEAVLSEHGLGFAFIGSIETAVIIKAKFVRPNSSEEIESTPINISFSALEDKESLLIYFIQSLDGVPLGAIRRCPECTNFFLHTTKRAKFFCSNRCAAKKVSRERRERIKKENPEIYQKELAKGAERARKSYEKKIKSKHRKAIPERRPRKHKLP